MLEVGDEVGLVLKAADEVGLVGELRADILMATSRSTSGWRAR
jgi:hypothetical protein